MANVKIVMTAHGRGEVSVDGVKQERVKSVLFESTADGLNVVRITQDVVADKVEIELAEAEIKRG